MPESVYAHDMRSAECGTCGEPVLAARGTPSARCESCGTEVQLPPRATEAGTTAGVDETARMAGLFAQLERFDPKGRLVSWLGPDLQRYELMMAQPERRAAGVAALMREWQDARLAVMAAPDDAVATRLFRIASVLGRCLAEADDHARSRVVLEAALDLLPDRAHRDIVRCRLARHALRAGDEEAHRAWLAECDPRPLDLEVDGELRSTRALGAYQRQDWRGVLDALGPSHREVPLAFTIAPLGSCLRAHALAGLGEHDGARDEIRHLASSVPLGYVRAKQTWARHPGPSSEYALAVARRASPAPTPTKGQPAALRPGPVRPRRWWWPF